VTIGIPIDDPGSNQTPPLDVKLKKHPRLKLVSSSSLMTNPSRVVVMITITQGLQSDQPSDAPDLLDPDTGPDQLVITVTNTDDSTADQVVVPVDIVN
jgi:hypothetical protein